MTEQRSAGRWPAWTLAVGYGGVRAVELEAADGSRRRRLVPALLAASDAALALLVRATARTLRGIYYVRDLSVWPDLVTPARTAKTVFFGKGAY